jgi:2-keto-4-pentenoate hydratase/2-oxohepta-3-ene-1,7-dioic acid hydratase in catechol pathway
MKIIGLRSRDGTGGVHVARIGHWRAECASLLAPLEAFWTDPVRFTRTDAPHGDEVALADVEVVPPVLPGARVLCVGLNYRDHVAEGSYADVEYAPYPTIFARWTDTLTVGGEPAPIPATEAGLDWEGEVAAYIGKEIIDADATTARESVLGFSTFNDLTSRWAQKITSQWTLGKNGDRSGPLGPLVTADEVGDLRDGLDLQTRVNGTVVQRGNTRDLVYELGEVLAHVSRTFTLKPGDVVATGTPSGVGYARTPPWLLQPGDVVEVEVDRLGVLSTPIVGNNTRHGGRHENEDG